MKAVVLAGGKGSRLRPFTYTGAKQLIPIANKPVLFYALEQLTALGVHEVAVVVGETGDQVRAALGDGSQFGLCLSYVQQDAPRGIAHAVGLCREFVGAHDFVVVLGDNFARDGIREPIDAFRAANLDCGVVLSRVPNPQAFGVAEFAGERLVRVVEKPAVPPSDLAITGIYYFSPAVFPVIAALRPSARGELEITDAIQALLEGEARVGHALLTGPWIDTGKMADILEANRLVLAKLERAIAGEVDAESSIVGAVVVGAGASVRRSVIKGPAIIAPDCRIEDAYIGPFTAIDRGSVVRGTEIADSIVLDHCRLELVPGRLEESLIGRDVVVAGVDRRPRVYQLMLGDHSRIAIPG
ncbi:MAG TPA: glucose-1-phosphate thymidylyltransferase [Dehalococcoidia bacterium]|nr:glucose-1-phosphate thymidylyltransferase [Dehalococcoidia bacterium]